MSKEWKKQILKDSAAGKEHREIETHATAVFELLHIIGVEEMLQHVNTTRFQGEGVVLPVYEQTDHTYPRKYYKAAMTKDFDHTTSSVFSVHEQTTPTPVPFPLYGLALEATGHMDGLPDLHRISLFVGFSESLYHGSLFGAAEGFAHMQPDGSWDEKALRTMQAQRLDDRQNQTIVSAFAPTDTRNNLKFGNKSILEVIKDPAFQHIAKSVAQNCITSILTSTSMKK